MFLDPGTDMDQLKIEWDRLVHKDWRLYFGGTIPTSAEAFWTGVVEYDEVHLEDDKRFANIAKFALRALSLPISNAVVERTFSFMNAVKIKSRNRIDTPMLVGILRLRVRFSGSGCCLNFVPTQRMFELFTAAMYEAPTRSAQDETMANAEETLTLCAMTADDDQWWDG